jgi:excisionase family DNA binding protein
MKVFTTGQVAKICKVAPRTVSKWFDSGRLKGYRIPGSQDRRIPREYLIKFFKEHGMPLGDLEDEAMAKVLIVAQDQVLIENLKRELPPERAFKVAVAASGFEAGIQAESFHPDCIIVDFSIGRVEALQICQNLRKNTDFGETILIALLPDDGQPMSFDRSSDQRNVQETVRCTAAGRASADPDRCQEGIGLDQSRQHPPAKAVLAASLNPSCLTRTMATIDSDGAVE